MDSIVAENLDLVFDEIRISDDSVHIGKSLKDTNIRSEHDILIVVIRRNDGEMIFNPSGQTRIMECDLLIVIGAAESRHKCERIV